MNPSHRANAGRGVSPRDATRDGNAFGRQRVIKMRTKIDKARKHPSPSMDR